LRARLIIPALKQALLLSRDREGAVLFADSAEFCKYLFSLSKRTLAGRGSAPGRMIFQSF
jgi:hypothetical protein